MSDEKDEAATGEPLEGNQEEPQGERRPGWSDSWAERTGIPSGQKDRTHELYERKDRQQSPEK